MIESTANKYIKVFLILVTIAVLVWVAAISMAVLVPFLLGILLAYMLMPVVSWLERMLPRRGRPSKTKRAISIIIVFFLFTLILVLFMAYIGSSVVAASGILINKTPQFIAQSVDAAREWTVMFKGHLPQSVAAYLDSFLGGLGPTAGKFMQDFMAGTMAVIPASMPTLGGFLVLPFFLFFVLDDYESFQRYFYEYLPPKIARHTASILTIIGNTMGRYLRSQFILGLIDGTIVLIGLIILKVEYAPALSLVTAVTQFIPIIGPVISCLVPAIITLALQPDKTPWVLILIVATQLLVNSVLANWIVGKFVHVHPALVMILLVVGGYIGGLFGAILSVPLAATVWQIFKYFHDRNQPVTE